MKVRSCQFKEVSHEPEHNQLTLLHLQAVANHQILSMPKVGLTISWSSMV
jgi:hypothetical protein